MLRGCPKMISLLGDGGVYQKVTKSDGVGGLAYTETKVT